MRSIARPTARHCPRWLAVWPFLLAGALVIGSAFAACVRAGSRLEPAKIPAKVLVAHRGASAYAPEHTLPAYELALAQGATYVEQDLGLTKDGVLVCLHDVTLERTTNVEDVFPDRFTEQQTPRGTFRRWFLREFTLEEVKRLDAGSWFGDEFRGETVPTWQEAIDVVAGRAGLFPELKAPQLYGSRGQDMAELVAESFRRNGLTGRAESATPVILQSFDESTLVRLAELLPDVPRVLLLGRRDSAGLGSAAAIERVAAFATGLGPDKSLVEARPAIVRDAHALGLTVIPYTFRSGSTGRFSTVQDEMRHFLYGLGVDGVFTDNPDRFPARP